MLYRFLRSKKGFTFVEIMVCVTVLGILTAVAVPVFAFSLKKQKVKDCMNQAQLIETTIQQTMTGMIDNGRKQEDINGDLFIPFLADSNFTFADGETVPTVLNASDVFTNTADPCNAKGKCVKFTSALTIGQIRGGYRANTKDPAGKDYDAYCKSNKNYLKKFDIRNTPMLAYLANGEMPVCPFVSDDATDEARNTYYVFSDGTVACSCTECAQARAS